ncbi:hypothetical protein LTR66_014539, partial [Elasticomyces elasticus]
MHDDDMHHRDHEREHEASASNERDPQNPHDPRPSPPAPPALASSSVSWTFTPHPHLHTNPRSDSPPPPTRSPPPPQEPPPRLDRQSSIPRPSIFSSGSNPLFSSAPARPTLRNIDPQDSSSAEGSSPAPRPLAALAASSPATRRARFEDEVRATVDRRRLPKAEKDADDPTTPERRSSRYDASTVSTLSRLFAVQAAVSPVSSRAPSYNTQLANPYTRGKPCRCRLSANETATLPDHLFNRGFLGGRHSDITVHAFGRAYKLHRLILDRAPFFTSALSEPWFESTAKEITLHPEEIDSSITRSAFELALKRLYGCGLGGEEDVEAIGLFATGCWLEMQDLVDSSIEAMLRLMTPENLSPLIKLVTNNYYGRAGDKLLASAKAMLCRDGWRMPLRHWDHIPGDIVREIVGGDGFFIDGEWERWILAKRILDRRLKARAVEAGLLEPGTRNRVLKAPESVNLMAVRFDGVYRKNSISTGRATPDSAYRWISLYTHPDIEPILVLLDEGIHYVHLDFEQLQFIRKTRDILNLPVMPEQVIQTALWMQMELRQKVLNSRDQEMELGISQSVEDAVATSRDSTMTISVPGPDKGKRKATDDYAIEDSGEDDMESGSWDGNGRPRKFWIPSSDCNIVMGGNAEPVIATSNALHRHASRLSATMQPEDLQWASDFAATPSDQRGAPPARPGSAAGNAAGETRPVSFTHYPPFRFAAEFPNPRMLKEKKRVYSRTVFYAGSLWNIYIQKVRSAKNPQLGVYLHRAKERETEEVIAGTAGLAQGSVDQRIGQLEREMLFRSERRARRRGRTDRDAAEAEEESGSGGDPDATL